MKTVYHEHNTKYLARKCNAWDLYLHHQGLKCSNCGVLVQEDVYDEGE